MKILSERSLMMDLGSFYIPDKSKSSPMGDDAHFISKHHQTIGLADGVAGWAKQGIDGGEYARQLMDNCVTTLYAEDKEIVYPQMVLEEAYVNTNVEGSSTACIITLTDEYLNVINVGDSGFMLFRNGNMIYKSSIQQHFFNCPCQLGKSSRCDDPSIAEELILGVRAGDVVVVGTDGLFDNVFEREMEMVIRVLREEGCLEPQLLAKLLAELALENSLIRSGDSPYTIAALMEGKFRSGGKPDDITVIVARIVPPMDIL
ncbi:hypothetical protein PVL29_023197 [Vitis rotundifolia]|uniref:Protein phosphatase n=1 Tax=Vitis rotundifolia TaxID=103349 RepID=A0AA38YN47_VITRO|nr:hypothetical protein PVL29_023197 [Vitis rotundifolia]